MMRIQKKSRPVFFAAIIVTSGFNFLIAGCSGGSKAGGGQADQQLVPVVEAVQAKYGSLPLTERLSGVAKALNQVELYPQISAAVVKVHVQNGDLVRPGEPLIQLRDTEFREQLNQAEANHQIAAAQAKQAEAELIRIQAELKRNLGLASKNLISDTELENIQTRAIAAEANAELARARVKQAQATVDERKEALSRTIIRAPVEGTVGNRNAEIGMLVSQNTRLFTLGQLDSVRVEVVLSDRMLSFIKAGQRCEIFLSNTDPDTLTASIARISPFLHPVTHSTTAEIDLANPGHILKPGMFVTVDIFYGESERATLIPLTALWGNTATTNIGVYVSSDSLAFTPSGMDNNPGIENLTEPVVFSFVPVDVIARGRLNAGIRGIEPGSWIVTIGQDLLSQDSGKARVRPVSWEWVQELQQLQREDLLEDIMNNHRANTPDSSLSHLIGSTNEDSA